MALKYVPPDPLKHGEIEEVFPDVFFVKGSVCFPLKGPITVTGGRNMIIVRQGDELIIVNSLRLDEEGLEKLDKLGAVKHVIRLGGYRGMDDPFYKYRYKCTVWGPKGARYFRGFDVDAEPYFSQDRDISNHTVLPINESKSVLINSSTPPEALLLINHSHGKILFSADCLQNCARLDEYFGFFSSIVMRIIGFNKAHNVGPVWYQQTKPDKTQIEILLELEFDHVLPAHGDPCIGQAFHKYKPAIERLK